MDTSRVCHFHVSLCGSLVIDLRLVARTHESAQQTDTATTKGSVNPILYLPNVALLNFWGRSESFPTPYLDYADHCQRSF